MKILTLNANLKGVGTYLRCFYFSRELARAGHDVTMATVSRDSMYRSKVSYKSHWIGETSTPPCDVPSIRMIQGARLGYKWLPGWGSGPLDIFMRMRELLLRSYDAIYGFEYQPNVSWPVYLTHPLQKYRFFSDWCDWYAGGSNYFRGYKWAHRIDRILEEQIRYRAEKVTVISRMLENRAIQIGIPREQVVYLPEGVDTEYIRHQPIEHARKKLNLEVNRPTIIAVNDDDMCRTVRIIGSCIQRLPDLAAVIVGNVSSAARQLAGQLRLERNMHWAGWVSDEDYPTYLSAANVLILPLAKDGNNAARFPAKVLDFLAAGRPVVMSDIGEVAQIIRTHRLGHAIHADDDHFAQSILALLENVEEASDIGLRARQVMERDWDWNTRSALIQSVLQ